MKLSVHHCKHIFVSITQLMDKSLQNAAHHTTIERKIEVVYKYLHGDRRDTEVRMGEAP